jgi:glycosyltransferase involved in cell wall biosynthesis
MGKSKVYNIEHAFQFDISIFEKIKNSNGIVYFYKMTFGWLGRRRINGWIQSLVTKNSICVAGFIRNNLIKYFNFSYKNTVTIYNGVDLKESNLNQAPGAICVKNNYKENNEKVLICVSRLSPEKGIEFLIDTMSILKETSVCFKLIIVGDGPLRDKLENMVAIKELSHYVQFIGFQNSVIPYLLKSDLFLLTSYHEGLPFSLLEAMACGLPCIVTDVGGNREVIVNNKNGYLIAPGDKFNLVNKIRYLLLNDEIRTTFSKNNIERIKKLFDINKNMRKVIDVICEN